MIFLFFGTGIFYQCANPMAPQGGPRDSLPPVVINMTPAFGTTNFNEKSIYIEFDEYVKLTNQQKEFFTSPLLEKQPALSIRRRGIQIDLPDSLAENTTYALNFGSSIEDNNEGNPLNGFRYVFSTGDYIDSLVMSGYAVDAFKKDSASKTFIWFYEAWKDSVPEYDSTVFNILPDVVGRAENNGIFIAENLKPVDYRIYAIQDNNNNHRYEPGVDAIGFLDTVYNPALMPAFDAWYDTMRKYVTAEPQLYFRMFRDDPFRRQYLAGQSRPSQHKAILNFGAYYPQIDSLEFEGIDPSRIIIEYLKPTRDSIAYWFNVPSEELPDTIKGSITYIRHDSVSNLVPETQRLSLGWKAFESRQDERERERREKEREKAIQEGRDFEKEANPFKVTVEVSSNLNPEKELALLFDYPLVEMDSSQISLTRNEDDRVYRVRYRLEQDTANIRRWIISAPWIADQRYRLEIPEGAIRNVAGEVNDSIRSEFSVMNADKYATLVFDIVGKTPESEYVLQLTDVSGNRILDEIRNARTGKHVFSYIDPGSVRLRVIEDINRNGQWDKGNLVERIQPERVEIFILPDGNQDITTKVGWEMENSIDMNVLFAPVTMESIVEQIKKEEAIRIRKYLETLEKNPPPQNNYQNQGTTGTTFNPTGGFNLR